MSPDDQNLRFDHDLTKTTCSDRKPPMVFNRRALAVFTLDDAELEREVVELFIAQLDDLLAALRRAVEPLAWYETTHALKGSSATVGAERIAAACRDAEALIMWPDPMVRRECRWCAMTPAELAAARHRTIASVAAEIPNFIEHWHIASGLRPLSTPATVA